MKKVILASVVAVAAVSSMNNAAAATVSACSGGVAAGYSWSTASETNANFVRQPFNGRCSANIFLVGDDNGAYFRVGAASSKGKSKFGGSSMGGGITPTTVTCASSGCVQADAAEAATSALSQDTTGTGTS